jgi:Predicted nucleic-acid-binding protein implicated in transcription termination
MSTKKIPVRRCIGCNEGKPKKELVRVVRNKEGEISIDTTGKMPGRGAYICRDKACLAKARKGKKIEKAFDCTIEPEVYERLEQEILGE